MEIKYYEIVPGSKVYVGIVAAREMKKKWRSPETISKIAEFLGVNKDSVIGNVAAVKHVLAMENPPEQFRLQFKKNRARRGYFEAKAPLIGKWKNFCKENSLDNFDFWHDIRFKCGMFNISGEKQQLWLSGDRFFLETSNDAGKFDSFKLIDRVEFLRVQLAYEEEQVKSVPVGGYTEN